MSSIKLRNRFKKFKGITQISVLLNINVIADLKLHINKRVEYSHLILNKNIENNIILKWI